MERPVTTVYIVRHAESEYNLAQRKAKGKDEEVLEDEEDFDVNFDPKLIDSALSAEGFSQAEACAAELQDIKFDVIFTSPLLRCLQTTDPIYQQLSTKPKVIVVPELRERITSSCDLPVDPAIRKEKFGYMDFSQLERFNAQSFWIKEALESTMDDSWKVDMKGVENNEALNELMKKIHPQSIEPQKALNERVQNYRAKLLEDSRVIGKTVLIVSHSAFLESFTATKYFQDDTPLDGNYLKNAECAIIRL